MNLAERQIYTISPIDEWKVAYDGKREIPEEEQELYSSTLFDFDRWMRISDEELGCARDCLLQKGSRINTDNKEFLRFTDGTLYGTRRTSIFYLTENGLACIMPRGGGIDRPISPNNTSLFMSNNLAEHIDLALLSTTRDRLRDFASELGLGLKSG